MKRKKYRLPPPPRSDALPSPAEIIEVGTHRQPPAGGLATPLTSRPAAGATSEADGVNIIALSPRPRLWLRVELTLSPGTDPGRAALDAARFVSRTCDLDRRLRMTLDAEKSRATGGELVLVFALGRWGTLEAQWVEEAKPRVSELATDFGGELKSVEVIQEG
jgi:hypothetical protein